MTPVSKKQFSNALLKQFSNALLVVAIVLMLVAAALMSNHGSMFEDNGSYMVVAGGMLATGGLLSYLLRRNAPQCSEEDAVTK